MKLMIKEYFMYKDDGLTELKDMKDFVKELKTHSLEELENEHGQDLPWTDVQRNMYLMAITKILNLFDTKAVKLI